MPATLKKKGVKKAPKKNGKKGQRKVRSKQGAKKSNFHTVSLKSPGKNKEWTVEELAEKEGVHVKTVLLWIRQEKIVARHALKEGGIRGKWFIPKATYKRPKGRNEQ